eukprot:CAMPEP_0118964958 /NCGR_PEP_ID=MMETSP1173-20130426/2560_1 /TAXON_ID=1034831 /ORGANISM="Rhizochromulina marina cf, Strain CCMP1243" /LENGTH=31 /DNA_ID= /DNA_START= /DNA_END= /DNA_ORIENTATION=
MISGVVPLSVVAQFTSASAATSACTTSRRPR